MENKTNTYPVTIKGTNERIDSLEKRVVILETKAKEEKPKEKTAGIPLASVISILFILALFLLLFFPEKEKKWSFFSTPDTPSWLETTMVEDGDILYIEYEKDGRHLFPGDEYFDTSHRARVSVEESDGKYLIYGGGVLWGAYEKR
ncbi:MAG: hypothetical protein ACI4S4_03700 [Candidatus Ornithospirochaeta sp.]